MSYPSCTGHCGDVTFKRDLVLTEKEFRVHINFASDSQFLNRYHKTGKFHASNRRNILVDW